MTGSNTQMPTSANHGERQGAMPAPVIKINPKVSPPCSNRLRSNLFNKLGIVDVPMPPLASPTSTTGNKKTVLGPNVKIIKAPLKRDDGPDPLFNKQNFLLETLGSLFRAGSPSSVTSIVDDSSTVSSATRRNLTFDEEVSVVHIPRRDQYSKRIQEHLWNSAETLQTAVMRNTVEYAADGWKWQDVREEDQHFQCPESGELIHPVHQEIARLIREEQGLPKDTPVWTPFLKQAPLGAVPSTSEAA